MSKPKFYRYGKHKSLSEIKRHEKQWYIDELSYKIGKKVIINNERDDNFKKFIINAMLAILFVSVLCAVLSISFHYWNYYEN